MLNWFRRNPVMAGAFASSAIMMISSFMFPLSTDQQGTLNGVVLAISAIIVSYSLAADGGLSLIVGFTKSILALGLAFGLHLTPDKQGVIMSFVATGAAMFVHGNVTASVNAAGNTVTVDGAGKAVAGPPAT